jgi:hypothetical protein
VAIWRDHRAPTKHYYYYYYSWYVGGFEGALCDSRRAACICTALNIEV